MCYNSCMAAAPLKMPPAVQRWFDKAKPEQLGELVQVLQRRQRMLEHPRRPFVEVAEEVMRDYADTLEGLRKYDEQE